VIELIELVRKIGIRRIMRSGQLLALPVVYLEIYSFPGAPGDTVESSLVVVLIALLVAGEFVRLGRLLSLGWLVWLGQIARFTGLGWAGTGFLTLLIALIGSESLNGSGATTLPWISGGVALAVSVYAFTIGRSRFSVRKFKMTGLSAAPGMRITALSDLHLGEYVNATFIRKAVKLSNAQSPDIVLLLGDYVDQAGSLAGELLEELSKLEAAKGVYAVLGNHDVGASDAQLIVEEIEASSSVNLLRNESIFLDVETEGEIRTLQIIGIESPGEWWGDEDDQVAENVVRTAIDSGDADFRLVMSHHPEIFDICVRNEIDLVTAGHTHGGQLAVPYLSRYLNVGRLAVKYLHGLYERNDTKMVITAGVGVGVIPARLGVPPEVTLIELNIDSQAS
jgi:predicted MPP superfamily phosphohydrolase